MGNCKHLFRRSRMRTIEVRKRAVEHETPCKEEMENVTACWRNSGVDSRNCVGLMATLGQHCCNCKYHSKKRIHFREDGAEADRC